MTDARVMKDIDLRWETYKKEFNVTTKEDFLKKNGKHYEDIWDEVNNPQDYPSPADDYIDDNKLMNGVKCITS